MGELVFLLLFLVICGVFFYMTFGFQVSILDTSGGAAMFPRIVIIFLAVVLIIRMIQVFREKEHKEFMFLDLFRGYRLFFLLSLIIYIVLFRPLGYILSTSLFLLVTVNVFYRETKGTFGSAGSIALRSCLSVGFVLGLYFFFAKVVHIMLPAGLIG